MERKNSNNHDISELIADGVELASRLERARNGEIELSEAVKPYLQLVIENERDEFTGIKTSEIWRYFRLTWSTPAETTPGRTMQYLIRDAAHPMHAVMGIASLENCAVQITCRDDFIGWNQKAFIDRITTLETAQARQEFEKLLQYLELGISGIDYSALCTEATVNNPSDEDIQQLLDYANSAEQKRQEAFYCGEHVRPILLDFSGASPSFSSVARASEMSYTQIYKSINRFYAWGYARWLDEKGYSKEELLQSETPVYEERKAVSKASKEELDALWLLAKERAHDLDGDEVYLTFGETMYDMLALEASSHPVTYLRALGNLSGILYPPDKLHPNKRFVVSQDIIEMLLRCCVNPGEMISGMDIRRRLWDRFGIIVGGSQFEMQILQTTGMILQIDEDALDENFSSFAKMLESMDFAELMADGILQIRLGGAEK